MIGNWLKPPPELHMGRLFSDEVACLVAAAALTLWSMFAYLSAAWPELKKSAA